MYLKKIQEERVLGSPLWLRFSLTVKICWKVRLKLFKVMRIKTDNLTFVLDSIYNLL